jgi:hypothetical protein
MIGIVAHLAALVAGDRGEVSWTPATPSAAAAAAATATTSSTTPATPAKTTTPSSSMFSVHRWFAGTLCRLVADVTAEVTAHQRTPQTRDRLLLR